MSKYKFKGLIKCNSCGGNYGGITENGRVVYICNSYRKGKCSAERSPIREEDLLFIVENHCHVNNIEFDEENLAEIIDKVIVYNIGHIDIYYKDDTVSRLLPDGNIEF